jgi:hypothetical protein
MVDPQQATFDKQDESKHQHLKVLYVSRFVNGKPMSKILVDDSVVVNKMPMVLIRRLSKGPEDLIKTNVVLNDF